MSKALWTSSFLTVSFNLSLNRNAIQSSTSLVAN
jgi:hypothetical protein